MKKYDILLLDADDTVFDFQAAAERAFLKASESFSLPHEKENYAIYAPINQGYWDLYSLGKIDKPTLLTRRFLDYGEKIGRKFDPAAFAKEYGRNLAEGSALIAGAKETLSLLKEKGVRLFLATNGISYVQRGRLKAAGIEDLFEKLFISDEIGVNKPNEGFFLAIERAIPDLARERTLLCGDSPLTDVALGKAWGTDTCLFAPKGHAEAHGATYVISSLPELLSVIFPEEKQISPI